MQIRSNDNPSHEPLPPQKKKDGGQADPSDYEYVIDELIAYDEKRDRYLVRWDGYPVEESTWEPPSHLPIGVINRFRRRKGMHPLPVSKHTTLQ